MASSALLPVRSTSSAKSIIMMAFFFTMPISRMMPIKPDDVELHVEEQQRQEGARARRGQSRENRDGMNVALIQHPQHDVDRQQRRQDQDRLRRERILEGRRGSLEAAMDAAPACRISISACIDGARRRTQVSTGRQVERDGHRRELSLVIDRQRRVRRLEMREGRQRHLRSAAGDHVDALQRIRRQLVLGSTSITT